MQSQLHPIFVYLPCASLRSFSDIRCIRKITLVIRRGKSLLAQVREMVKWEKTPPSVYPSLCIESARREAAIENLLSEPLLFATHCGLLDLDKASSPLRGLIVER